MDNFKNSLFIFICFLFLGASGYWAFSTLDSGTEYSEKQKQQQLENKNSLLEQGANDLEQSEEINSNPEVSLEDDLDTTPKPLEANLKHQILINELQELINDNITVKLKSRGTRVGTVQNFLNLYNNTSNKVDNDYGNSTKKLMVTFQQDVGLSPATGEAGPDTFLKMIEWLKKQG